MPRFPAPTAPAELNADPVIEDPLLRTASNAFAALDRNVTHRLMQQAAYASDLEKYHTHALEPLGIIAYGYLLPLLEELRRQNATRMPQEHPAD